MHDGGQLGSGVVGVLLAAGAGSRMGRAKALVHREDGTSWLRSAREVLLAGGCSDVVTVLGAEAKRARCLIPGGRVVVATDWATGMSASLTAGLEAVADDGAQAVMVHLVDLPDVGESVVRRVLAHAAPTVLARAVYGGRPGHPVLIGRNHLAPLVGSLHGDEGAHRYLAGHGTIPVECSDLAGGHDVDSAEQAGFEGHRVGP